MTEQERLVLVEAWLPDARLWVRRSSDKFDDELRQTLGACVLGLWGAGVRKIFAEDPLLKQAAKLYVKGNFGYDEQSEKWNAAYEHLKASLSLSDDYRGSANG